MTRRIAILGAGGHGKVVFSVLQAQGVAVYGFYDDTEERWGLSVLGVPVRGPVEAAAGDGIEAAVLAIGDNRARQGWRSGWISSGSPPCTRRRGCTRRPSWSPAA